MKTLFIYLIIYLMLALLSQAKNFRNFSDATKAMFFFTNVYYFIVDPAARQNK